MISRNVESRLPNDMNKRRTKFLFPFQVVAIIWRYNQGWRSNLAITSKLAMAIKCGDIIKGVDQIRG